MTCSHFGKHQVLQNDYWQMGKQQENNIFMMFSLIFKTKMYLFSQIGYVSTTGQKFEDAASTVRNFGTLTASPLVWYFDGESKYCSIQIKKITVEQNTYFCSLIVGKTEFSKVQEEILNMSQNQSLINKTDKFYSNWEYVFCFNCLVLKVL